MKILEMIKQVDNFLDSKGLKNPSIRKGAIRKIADFIQSTNVYLKNGHLNLPSDKRVFCDSYYRYKQSALSGAEKSAINHMYDIYNTTLSNNITPKTAYNNIEHPTIKAQNIASNTYYSQNEDFKTGFAPWIGENPQVLILGSLPGDESIKQQKYYAKRQNAFWKIMRTLFDTNTETDNKEFITSCEIALWDCVHSAERKGSLDSDIKDDTVVANDIKGLIAKYPTINTIIFNGNKAKEYYNKYCNGINCSTIKLISTSSAATKPFEDKVKEWSIIKELIK